MGDTRTPFVFDDELTTSLVYLRYLRGCVQTKLDGVDEAGARWSPVPSGTSLLWLVKHLTFVETMWLPWGFAGLDVHVPANELDDGDTVASVLEGYREATRLGDEVVEGADPAQPSARQVTGDAPPSLRWVVVHLVDETARHAGHADLVRELLDGTTGR